MTDDISKYVDRKLDGKFREKCIGVDKFTIYSEKLLI